MILLIRNSRRAKSIYVDRNQKSTWHWWRGLTGKGHERNLRGSGKPFIFNWVMVIWVYTFVRINYILKICAFDFI